MNLEESSRIGVSILLVDRKFVTYTELKDDMKKTSYEAIGVSFFHYQINCYILCYYI